MRIFVAEYTPWKFCVPSPSAGDDQKLTAHADIGIGYDRAQLIFWDVAQLVHEFGRQDDHVISAELEKTIPELREGYNEPGDFAWAA